MIYEDQHCSSLHKVPRYLFYLTETSTKAPTYISLHLVLRIASDLLVNLHFFLNTWILPHDTISNANTNTNAIAIAGTNNTKV